MIAKSKGFKRLKRGLKKVNSLQKIKANNKLKIFVEGKEVTENTSVYLDFGDGNSRTAHTVLYLKNGKIRNIQIGECKSIE